MGENSIIKWHDVVGLAASGVYLGVYLNVWDFYAPEMLKIPVLGYLAAQSSFSFHNLGYYNLIFPVALWLLKLATHFPYSITKLYLTIMASKRLAASLASNNGTILSEEGKLPTHFFLVTTLLLVRGRKSLIVAVVAALSLTTLSIYLVHIGAPECTTDELGDGLQAWILWCKRRSRDLSSKIVTTVRLRLIRAHQIPLYKYSPCTRRRQVRLLKLNQRSMFPGVLRGDILIVNIDEAPTYEAVSYTWSHLEPTEPIIIGGSKLLVSQELARLLHARTSRQEDKFVWVDFLCIDQSNADDKAQQIPLMRDIYQSASQTTLWLEDRYDSTLAADALQELVAAVDSVRNDEAVTLADKLFRQVKEQKWTALRRVLEHRYFSRSWICQEVVVSRHPELHLGGKVFPWTSLVRTARLISDPQLFSVVMSSHEDHRDRTAVCDPWSFMNINVLDSLRDSMARRVCLPLGFVLSYTFDFEATMGEDKIIAMLGIADRDDIWSAVSEDIRKSEFDMFRETAQKLLVSPRHSPYILPLAGIGYARLKEAQSLPSWCPDWKTGRLGGRFSAKILPGAWESLRQDSNSGPPYAASGRSSPLIRLSDIIDGAISIDGFEIDVVKRLGIGPGAGDSVARFNLFIDTSFTMAKLAALEDAKPGPTDHEVETAFWRTLIADRANSRFPAPATWATFYRVWSSLNALVQTSDAQGLDEVSSILTWLPLLQVLRDRDPPERHGLRFDLRLLAVYREFMRRVANATTAKRFCTTENGWVGLVPESTEIGDRVCIISGMQTPYLLRQVRGRQDMDVPIYQLVGECYIHGVMRGEACGMGEVTEFHVV